MMRKNDLRPAEFPRLEHYEPSGFMLPTSHYDAKKADRAVADTEYFRHSKVILSGKLFWLLPWLTPYIFLLLSMTQSVLMRCFPWLRSQASPA